jgi:hypothetical protein
VSYSRQTWVDGPAGGTPINASRLNVIETGLQSASDSADTAVSGLAGKAATGHTHISSQITDLTEAVQDLVAASLVAGTGISVSYNDAAGTITITGTGGSGSGGALTVEDVRDTIGAALIGTGLVTVSVDDAADTITVATTATANATDAQLRDRTTHTGAQAISTVTSLQATLDGKALLSHTHPASQIPDFTEAAQDAVAALLAGASGVTLSYDDAANTLTITGGGTGTGVDAEQVRDIVGVAMIGAGVITVAVNDAADTITISSSATQNSTDSALRDRSTHTGTQAIASVVNLQSTLDGKAALVHTHTSSQVSDFTAAVTTVIDSQPSAVSQVMVWRYTGGAWPTLPATQPGGVIELHAIGPAYPTVLPTWTGLAAGKVPLSYSKAAVL